MAAAAHQLSSTLSAGVPNYRLVLLKVDSNAAASFQAECALDPDSDEGVVELFMCAVCTELMLEEIYQCGNGHTICKQCKVKINKKACVQCKAQMTTGKGNWIRNRALEQLLEQMWIRCPFKNRGCSEILSKDDFRTHTESCDFGDNVAHICHHFYKGRDCTFRADCGKPKESLEHFRNHHMGCYGLTDLPSGHVGLRPRALEDMVKYPIVLSEKDRHYLLVVSVDRENDSIFFTGIYLNKPAPGTRTVKLKIAIKSRSDKFPDYKFEVSMVPFSNAATSLESRPEVRLFKSSVERDFADSRTGRVIMFVTEKC